MPKRKLDNSVVALAYCPPTKKKIDLWDETITGFVLEIRASGGKTYYLRYFDQNGRQRQHKIGRCEDISFQKAKDTAKRLRSEVVLGGDPAAKKEERKAIPTYSWLADQHLAHAKTYQKSFSSTEIIMRLHIRPKWDRLRLNEIDTREVAKWLAEKAEQGLKPATVEKIRVVFNRSFKLALQWNVPGAQSNPVAGVPRRRFDNARERFLTAEEAKRLHDAVQKSNNAQLKYIIGLLLMTAARVSELLQAKWEHVDLERKVWLIPISKTGKARRVPLSPQAIELIGKLPRFEKCPYVVPNPDTRKPYVSIKRAWQTARKEAKLWGLRIHDLRHSAASFMINAGIDLFHVGKVLGHADHKSTMRYSHLANDTLMRAVEAGAANLKGAWSSSAS